jgi:glutaredoxin 3
MAKHNIEVFSAGCRTCREAVDLVKRIAGSEHDVVVHDMQRDEVSERAKQHGIERVPAVLIDGKLAACCSAAEHGVEESIIRAALR